MLIREPSCTALVVLKDTATGREVELNRSRRQSPLVMWL
jgi:hypothetical protein